MSKEAPVGFTAVRLGFELDADATPEQLETLLKLTKWYCVVYQSLAHPVPADATVTTLPGAAVQ